MKHFLAILFTTLLLSCSGNKGVINADNNGFIAEGYDVTEYFNGNALEGKDAFVASHNGANYKFVSDANKEKFKANPASFEPKYGGYCAYAVGAKGSKVSINPKSFTIEDGKLYLFYDNALIDTKQKWLEENPAQLKKQAEANWIKITKEQ
ncbi:YHS domain-containing (seleno)protein [Patiriisocius sp. Uisw_017]|jgi:YHS domain-containing protein|uniref:YHS domain-containing (seleno)protein n=1 Tax=Patiriisocius sp. Uisw_017 TaxID=3230968 RepID=UPI0039E79C96